MYTNECVDLMLAHLAYSGNNRENKDEDGSTKHNILGFPGTKFANGSEFGIWIKDNRTQIGCMISVPVCN